VTAMSTIITALVLIAMILTTSLTLAQSAFTSMDYMAQCWKLVGEAVQESLRTNITAVSAQESGGSVEVLILNSGSERIAQFDNWDVIVQYYDDSGVYYILEAEYVEGTSPGDNQWSVGGIYTDDSLTQNEVFEPGILNPGEVMLLEINPVPSPYINTMCLVIVSTPGGVTASMQFEV
jgi:hypothetical protein